jgi:uncharacterized damage-inducible protein DinB
MRTLDAAFNLIGSAINISSADYQRDLLARGCRARRVELVAARERAVRRIEGAFSLVEHAWHLADLEKEGFGERIRRLRDEERPSLPDFDGARLARERAYRSLPLAPALAAFALARFANVASLRALDELDWERGGEQEGVGGVRLSDIPRMMAEHDAAHRAEIEALARALAAASKTLDMPSP